MVPREIVVGSWLGPGLAASVGILTLGGLGTDRHGGVRPMTLLVSGELGWNKVAYSGRPRQGCLELNGACLRSAIVA